MEPLTDNFVVGIGFDFAAMNTTFPDYATPMITSSNATTTSPPTLQADLVLELIRFIVQRIIVPMVVIVGVAGNVISMVVLSRPTMTSSTNCYLFGLAIADVLYLLCSMTLSFKHYQSICVHDVYKIWYPYGKVFSDLFANASVWFTVSFTAERYIAVKYPVRGRSLCTPNRAKIVLAVVSFVTTILTFPEFFESEIRYIKEDIFVRVEVVDSQLALSTSYTTGYYWFFIVSFTIVPLLALATLNSILIRSVYSAQRFRSTITFENTMMSSKRRQSEQQKITILLIVMVVVFIVCQTPYACLLVYKTNVVPTQVQITHFRIAANFTNLLIQLNAAVNIFLYVAFSSRFRKTFSRTFCWPSPPPPRYSFHATETSAFHNRSLIKPKRRKTVVTCCREPLYDISPTNGVSMSMLSHNRLSVNSIKTNLSLSRTTL